jgi:hypothetical protein
MLPLHPLATAMQADREREIRERAPLLRGLPRGRHPQIPETGLVHEGHAHPHAGEGFGAPHRAVLGKGA